MSLRIFDSSLSLQAKFQLIRNPKVTYFYRQLKFLRSRLGCIIQKIEVLAKILRSQYFFQYFLIFLEFIPLFPTNFYIYQCSLKLIFE